MPTAQPALRIFSPRPTVKVFGGGGLLEIGRSKPIDDERSLDAFIKILKVLIPRRQDQSKRAS